MTEIERTKLFIEKFGEALRIGFPNITGATYEVYMDTYNQINWFIIINFTDQRSMIRKCERESFTHYIELINKSLQGHCTYYDDATNWYNTCKEKGRRIYK